MNVPLGISCTHLWHSKLYNNKESRELKQITFFDDDKLYIPANCYIKGIYFAYEPLIMESMYFPNFNKILQKAVVEITPRQGKKIYHKCTLVDTMYSIMPRHWPGQFQYDIKGVKLLDPIKTTRQTKIVLHLGKYKELQEGVKFIISVFIQKIRKGSPQKDIVIIQTGGEG